MRVLVPGEAVAARPKPHDFALLETTGYLDRVGITHYASDPRAMFRQPSKVLGAYRSAV